MPSATNANDLETPSVYVDLDVLDHNIRSMQERCRGWGVGLRPHTKTHKIPEIAQMQLDAGAVGITVAKIGEAEVLPGEDVLIAYPIMADKLPRLQALQKAGRRVTVVVDSVEAARGLPGIGADGRGGRGRRPLRRRAPPSRWWPSPAPPREFRGPVLLAVVDRRGRASTRPAASSTATSPP